MRRNVRVHTFGFVLGISLAVSTSAHAQQAVTAPPANSATAAAAAKVEAPELVTDRPDFTESSEVMWKGGFQFESGFSYEGDKADEVSARSMGAPSALMRIGLGHKAELRIGGDGWLSESAQGSRTTGYSDVEVGAKIRLFNQDQIGVDLAVLPMVSLPVGADGFTSGAVDPTVKLTWARELPAGFGLTGNVNYASITEDGSRFNQGALSFSLGHDLFAGWGYYVEAYSFSKMSHADGAGVTLNGGFSHGIGDNMQFDIEAGRGVTAAAPDWFMGFGFALRGPFRR